jgi:DNA-binding SARP family transcriptional activator
MSLTIQLLGRPRLVRDGTDSYEFRSRKSWAVLAYLVLRERPPSRSQLAALLFCGADDPVRALRWSLSEIRRGLGDDGTVTGDPVRLRLSSASFVDIDVVTRGSWSDAVGLAELGSELLDGLVVRDAAAYDTWLLSQQRHVAAASEAILHEAALRSMSRGALDVAAGYAARAVAMNPLDENHQALLIRLYRLSGEDDAAAKQFAACIAVFERDLGAGPGATVEAAARAMRSRPVAPADDVTIDAMIEAGSAAVSAGAVEVGLGSLRTAARLADQAHVPELRIRARLVLAETLIHSLGGLDEQGLATLVEADEIALADDRPDAAAHARTELGYVDFLEPATTGPRYGSTTPSNSPTGRPRPQPRPPRTSARSPVTGRTIRWRSGCSTTRVPSHAPPASHVANHSAAPCWAASTSFAETSTPLPTTSMRRSRWLNGITGCPSCPGRRPCAVRCSCGATTSRARKTYCARPSRACQFGDPCWEGVSARGLALVAAADGDAAGAFEILADARRRCNRLADPYVWLDGYILDAQCDLGCRHEHPDTARWVRTLRELASRGGMRELTVRSLVHGAALGTTGDADAAGLLAADIDSPILASLVASLAPR